MKVLLLDTNLSSLPIYQYLINLGHEVFVVGVNNTDRLSESSYFENGWLLYTSTLSEFL